MSETTWTPADLDELRARMLLEQDDLAARLREHRRTGPECGDSVDHANVNVATELDVLAEARDRELLTQVERILQRLGRHVRHLRVLRGSGRASAAGGLSPRDHLPDLRQVWASGIALPFAARDEAPSVEHRRLRRSQSSLLPESPDPIRMRQGPRSNEQGPRHE
ncbi:hypothetical protein ASF37_12280 [Aeromicrobium sp. Leaf289]|nr:hypothetical protein [Aeromicrobium sp. Leaf289]KQP77320.1 hypothetical protein ASF37_12280 [Aeromicrobium sp. Leaf289]